MKTKKIIAALFFMSVLLLPISANCEEWLKSAYDGRTAGIVTPTWEQGNTALCWAYSAVGAAETSILKAGIATGESSNFNILSPTQLGYACQNRGSDPLQNTSEVKNAGDYRQSKGSSYYASSLFSQWCGPVGGKLADNCNGWENAKYCLTESPYINVSDLKNSEASRLELKKAIVKYGAVTFSYNNLNERYYYNPLNETGAGAASHACMIIGWDDNIPASSFLPGGATQNGGWLVKNSYSSLPYFYLSYDNSSSNIYAFSFEKRENYASNYFYDSDTEDFGLGSLLMPKYAANVFEAKKENECVAAVNVGIDGNNANIKVRVYTDLKDTTDPTSGVLAATGSLDAEYPGYYTIPLSNTAELKKGSYFSVVAETSKGGKAYFKLTQNNGQSFINNGNWSKARGVPRIKAYTKKIDKKLEFSASSVVLNTNENKDEALIVACYDNNYLNDLRVFSAKDSKRFDIPSEWQKRKGCRLKAMLWKSLETMTPDCAEETAWE